jgi:hypothetical protein
MTDTEELTTCALAMGWKLNDGIWHDQDGNWQGALDPEPTASDMLYWLHKQGDLLIKWGLDKKYPLDVFYWYHGRCEMTLWLDPMHTKTPIVESGDDFEAVLRRLVITKSRYDNNA